MKQFKLPALLFATGVVLMGCADSQEALTPEEQPAVEETSSPVVDSTAIEDSTIAEETEASPQGSNEYFSAQAQSNMQGVEIADTTDIQGLYAVSVGPEELGQSSESHLEYYVSINDDGTFHYIGVNTELGTDAEYLGAEYHTNLRGRGTYVNSSNQVAVLEPSFLEYVVLGSGYVSEEYGEYVLQNVEFTEVYRNRSSNPYYGFDQEGNPTVFTQQMTVEGVEESLQESDASLFRITTEGTLLENESGFEMEPIDAVDNEVYSRLMEVSPHQYVQQLRTEVSELEPIFDEENETYHVNSVVDFVQFLRVEDDNQTIPIEVLEPNDFSGYYTEDNYEVQPTFAASIGQPLWSTNDGDWRIENVRVYAYDEESDMMYQLADEDGSLKAYPFVEPEE